MKTLPPAPPLKPDLPTRRINQGMELFERLRCDECHLPPTYTDEDVYDVGIPDASGSVAFNPPSLLGVSQRTHFLHDGRIKDLKDVFTKQKHMLEKDLSPQELALLLDFLQSL
jgi:cytochrome c peroxidase